eukprot:tig00000411_g553.t1
MRNWAQQGKLGSTDARESPNGPTQSTREREDWSRGITQCCLLTLLNRQDVPERILYASVDLRPPDRPRKKTTLRRRSQGKVLASCLPTRAERDAEPHVLWMQGGVKWSATAAVVDTLATIERASG